MKNRLIVIGLIAAECLLAGASSAQTTSVTERDLTRRMQDMRALEGYAKRKSERDAKNGEPLPMPELDKKAKDRIRQLRVPAAADVEQYRQLLAQKRTGIIKIFPNYDCLSRNVVRIDGDCLKFVPESSNFSFRESSYSTPLYHDIGFERGELISNAFFSQGVIVTLGDVPIADISTETAGMEFLSALKPDTTFEAAQRSAKLFRAGTASGQFRYSSHAEAAVNTTYAMRMMAYNVANSLPPLSPDRTLTELKFLSLSQDKREDVIVVFRVIRKDEVGGLTLVWKELSRNPAPKLRFAKGQPLADFK